MAKILIVHSRERGLILTPEGEGGMKNNNFEKLNPVFTHRSNII